MSDCSETNNRMKKLRELRQHLCESEQTLSETSKTRDWVVSELCELKKLADKDNSTVSDIKCQISRILNVLESDKGVTDE